MLSARLEAVPFPVVVDRPVLGDVGREAAGAEARLYCGALKEAVTKLNAEHGRWDKTRPRRESGGM